MKKDRDPIGKRMKENYEHRSRHKLIRRMPVVLRFDGKAFHTFTKGLARPFDNCMATSMKETMLYLMRNIQGAKIGYTQSDEISIVCTDYEKLNTEAWFDNNLQKMVSVGASMCTLQFNKSFGEYIDNNIYIQERMDKFNSKRMKALFDCRAFNLPKEEVYNYLYWRQKDCIKNAISSIAQTLFSHKELQGVGTQERLDLIYESGYDMESVEDGSLNGYSCIKSSDGILIEMDGTLFQEHKELINELI